MRYIRDITLILFIVLAAASCTKDDSESKKTIFVDDTGGKQYHMYDLYCDEYGNEGLVVYVEEGSTYKYIQVISVDETTAAWGPTGETVFKGNQDSVRNNLRFGLSMLQSMKQRGIEHFPAQKWCDEKNGGELYPRAGSWMLPSYMDMRYICGPHGSKVNTINSKLTELGKTPLSLEEYYWCIEEDYEGYLSWDDGDVHDHDPDNRAVICSPQIRAIKDKDFWIKKIEYRVRAVKTILYIWY